MPANTSAPPAKKKGRRARVIVIAVVVLLVAGIGFGSYWSVSTVRASFPQTSGTLQLKGLSGPVQVMRDAQGVPQIYADTPQDLFRAQGYVQAQDRFYEMDVRRHFTSGTLSEMFGSGQVANDAFLRTMGWDRVAQQEWDTQLSASTKSYLEAYSAGVNAYLTTHHGSALSVEYAILGLKYHYTPAKWTPIDSIAWLKAMAWDLRGNMQDEIDRALMTTRMTTAQIAQLYPAYPYSRNSPIVQGGSVVDGQFTPPSGVGSQPAGTLSTKETTALGDVSSQLTSLDAEVDKLPSLLGPAGTGIGSNSWVVSGKYTTTGKPLLANDPHLAPQQPSLWYQMGLHCRTVSAACPFDVAGFTFSGMPGVVIGHNQTIAWGMTNMGADVTDLYLEKVTPTQYLVDGQWHAFTTRQETIKVAGGKSRVITVRTTRDGMPIVSDRSDELSAVGSVAPVSGVAPDRRGGYAVALKWTALQPSKTMDAVFGFDKATNFQQFRTAAGDFAVPAQNLIYADTNGHIGYQAPGRIPIRAKGDNGTYPMPGWDSQYAWTGYVPQSAMPWEEDPSQGYIVTANQPVTDASYPYPLTQDWDYGTRSQRIISLIKTKTAGGGKISMDDMQSMQLDDSSEIAEQLVPYLLKINVPDSYVRQAQQLLQGWDFDQDTDSAAAAYFNAVWRNVLKLAFGDKMPYQLRPKGQCLRVTPVGGSGPVDNLNGTEKTITQCGTADLDQAQPDGGDRWFEVVRDILTKPNSPWWNTATTSSDPHTDRDQLLLQAMTDARYELTSKLGKDINTWTWGRLHTMELRNQTLGTDGPTIVKWLLNRGPWQLSGGQNAVDATGWNAAVGYDVVWVPSMRMVVNLADFDQSRWINLTGESGHAYDAHYSDQTRLWAEGKLLPWHFTAAEVKDTTQDTLTLTP
jgi:penicillin G amidase